LVCVILFCPSKPNPIFENLNSAKYRRPTDTIPATNFNFDYDHDDPFDLCDFGYIRHGIGHVSTAIIFDIVKSIIDPSRMSITIIISCCFISISFCCRLHSTGLGIFLVFADRHCLRGLKSIACIIFKGFINVIGSFFVIRFSNCLLLFL
jgi:hypothetical protein